MNKQEFIKAYTICDAVPQRIKKHLYGTKAFSKATKNFIEDNFPGLAEVKDDVYANFSILLNEEQLAQFLKLLLTSIYGRIFLKIHIFCDEKKLRVTITSDSPFPLDYEETNDIIRQARRAGFQLYQCDSGFSLAIALSKKVSMSVYAISADHGALMLKISFNDIFFYGYGDKPNKRSRKP